MLYRNVGKIPEISLFLKLTTTYIYYARLAHLAVGINPNYFSRFLETSTTSLKPSHQLVYRLPYSFVQQKDICYTYCPAKRYLLYLLSSKKISAIPIVQQKDICYTYCPAKRYLLYLLSSKKISAIPIVQQKDIFCTYCPAKRYLLYSFVQQKDICYTLLSSKMISVILFCPANDICYTLLSSKRYLLYSFVQQNDICLFLLFMQNIYAYLDMAKHQGYFTSDKSRNEMRECMSLYISHFQQT